MNGNYNEQNQNGNSQGTPICPYCGAPIRADASFCGNCGRSLRTGYIPVQPNVDKMGIFDYILSMILFSLPIIGLVFMLYWGFSSTTGINRKNFARAYLILYVIQVVLIFVIMLLFGSVFTNLSAFAY